jgi:hypothetical protein
MCPRPPHGVLETLVKGINAAIGSLGEFTHSGLLHGRRNRPAQIAEESVDIGADGAARHADRSES